jgi:hypothetical protein
LLLYKGRVVVAGLTSAVVDGKEGVSVLEDAVDDPSITTGAAASAATGTTSIWRWKTATFLGRLCMVCNDAAPSRTFLAQVLSWLLVS